MINTWSDLMSVLPFPEIGGFQLTDIVVDMLSWLPMGRAQVELAISSSPVEFVGVPDQLIPSFVDDGLAMVGAFATVKLAWPRQCTTGGDVAKLICRFIVDHPGIFQPKSDLLLSFSFVVSPPPEAGAVIMFGVAFENVVIGNLVLNKCGLELTIDAGVAADMEIGLVIEFTFWAGGQPIKVFGKISFGESEEGPFLSLVAGFEGYATYVFGNPYMVLADVQIGPIVVFEFGILYYQFQGTLIWYSPHATGNPAYLDADSPLIDFCAAGGVDALAQNCLIVTAAVGQGANPGSLPNAFFYLSTHDVEITGRSLLCIVTTVCLTPDSPIGKLLGSVRLEYFTTSFAIFPVTLLDGTRVPSGFFLRFKFDMFDMFTVTADIRIEPLSGSLQMGVVGAAPGLDIEASAYFSVRDAVNTYFYVRVELNPLLGFMVLPELLCKFADVCSLHPSMSTQGLLGRAFDVTLTVSFALKSQSVTLLNGHVVQIPPGFQFSFITSILGWKASLVITVHKIPGGIEAMVVGKLDAINTGPFKLCASSNNCRDGPYFMATFDTHSTSATLYIEMSCYVQIFGVSVYAKVILANSYKSIAFGFRIWDFYFNAMFREDFLPLFPGGAFLAIPTGMAVSFEMGDVTKLFTALINKVRELVHEIAVEAEKALAAARAEVNKVIRQCRAAAHALAVEICSDCIDVSGQLFSNFENGFGWGGGWEGLQNLTPRSLLFLSRYVTL